ncbi:hypothetical protein F2Q69_00001279 [Brassica cretica]|uniref:Uncharacterized protein n=1 Tax=Brassica cretica TaxID=69181 RepID=A0A8S9PFE0_BRACR|nr:hypothetical protein F2Q69_00001279 [Brassica cretica]
MSWRLENGSQTAVYLPLSSSPFGFAVVKPLRFLRIFGLRFRVSSSSLVYELRLSPAVLVFISGKEKNLL